MVLLKRVEAFIEPSVARDYLVRVNILRVSWEIFRDHALVGVGIGGYQLLAPAYRSLQLIVPHNVYLYFLTEFGIVGFGLFLFWVIALFSFCVQGLKRGWAGDERVVLLSLLAGLVIFFVEATIISFTFKEKDLWCFIGLSVVGVQLLAPFRRQSTVPTQTPSLRAGQASHA
jgi:O-antigen ligase